MHFSHAEDFQIQQEAGTAINQLSANAQEQRKSKQEWKARWQYMTAVLLCDHILFLQQHLLK